MKNQYFGDQRDFFKYDLLLDIVESQGSRRLTYIPMLTPNDESRDGVFTRYDCAGRRHLLYKFLQEAVASGRRDIKLLREVMPMFALDFIPYCDDHCFEQPSRNRYFDSVPCKSLVSSVIFFDPDVGLQTRTSSYMNGRGPEKYLMYSELAGICSRASSDSVVVVYQHLQKDARKRTGDVERRLDDLKEHLVTCSVWAVQRGDLAFLVIARNNSLACRIGSTVRAYALRYGLKCAPNAHENVAFERCLNDRASAQPLSLSVNSILAV